MSALSISRSAVGRTIFSIALVTVGGWTAYKGVELIRYHYLHADIAAMLSATPSNIPTASEIDAAQARAASWRDTGGLAYMARIDYRDLAGTSLQSAPDAMRDSAEVLALDPVNGQAWMDFARASRVDPQLRPVALAAWSLSAVAAPREYPILRQRFAFLMGIWPTADREQKQQFLFELQFMANIYFPTFNADWKNMLAQLPVDRKRMIEDEIRAYMPTYR